MLEIAFGRNKSDTNWKTEYLEWEEFIERLKKVRRTHETMQEYDRMPKPKKEAIKDGPAFVGGAIKGGRRKKQNIENRWLITLDADQADESFIEMVELVLGGVDYAIYSTHSHRKDKPKYRVIIPTDREMTPDEFVAASRMIADQIGMDYFDPTTSFKIHQLMYLPSCSRDAKPILVIGKGERLKIDEILGQYKDWKDIDSWPRHEAEKKLTDNNKAKQQDPKEKQGIIGLFCQTYPIAEGIERFLSDKYEPGTLPNRYTYKYGTSANGLEIFPDQDLAYSYQNSDPVADGHSKNLFDLVRIHKFGDLDDDVKPRTPSDKYPSYLAMKEFVFSLPEIKKAIVEKKMQEALTDFSDELQDKGDDSHDPDAWKEQLELHPRTGEVLQNARNAEIILSNGPFKGALGYDAFGNTEVVLKDLPWRKRIYPNREYEPWLGSDDKRLMHYFGKVYNFKSASIVHNAFTEVVHRNTFHPIKDYLEAQEWDGVERVETVFIDYLGAEDCHYVRSVTKAMFVAAVKRIYEPGCKFDEMLVLVGPQGAGKSSLLAKLGMKWFSDSLRTFENKEAGEHLQRAWIFEIGELAAMKKAEVEEIKTFLSKTEDRYRVAYDRQVSEFPRKCVFFGTTNNYSFLNDPTGNRRFWPVDVNPKRAKYNHWNHMTQEIVNQIWAEALYLYRMGEDTQLDEEAAKEAERMQKLHTEEDPREGLIKRYLEIPLPENWDEMDLWKRRAYLDDPTGHIERKTVCAAEIWAEALGNDPAKFNRWEARAIRDILRNLPGWRERSGKTRVAFYGLQRLFEKVY